MDYLLGIAASILTAACALLPLTTAIMIFSLRRKGHDPLASLSINPDLNSLSRLRREYIEAEGNEIVSRLNLLSFYLAIGGLLGLPIAVALAEAVPIFVELW